MNTKTLKVVVVGARRGKTFALAAQRSGLELAGVCDINTTAWDEWKSKSGVRLYDEFDNVLNDASVDAVCIATPADMHGEQSIAALKAGKHVICEVPAVRTLEEGGRLIETVRSSGKTYMMAENYCYCREVLMVQHMVERGLFGELTYASGAYIHDIRNMLFTPEGTLTWRGERRRDTVGNSYPTHSMGPVCRWLGINRTDRLASLASFASNSRSVQPFAARLFPERKEYQEPDFFTAGDTCSTSIFTDKHVLIDCRVDYASPRPHDMFRYELQGTKGSFFMRDGVARFWIEGLSESFPHGGAKDWDPIEKFAPDFEHPLWQAHGEEAKSQGHGGGDYFVLKEFAQTIHEGRTPAIDVYDAVAWSAVMPLSEESIRLGNQPVPFPDIARGPQQPPLCPESNLRSAMESGI